MNRYVFTVLPMDLDLSI